MYRKNPYVQYMYSYPHKTAYRPLKGVNLRDYGQRFAGAGHGLYFHVPFCQSKCGYCNLFSVTGLGAETVERYLDAVGRQVSQYAGILREAGAVFSDFTMGGGTPLLLEAGQLERVFDLVDGNLEFEQNRQIVVETAPNQTRREKLNLLKRRGVTRVSMGIQSFSDRELAALGRGHGGQQARRALELLKSYDFPCVNVDFIYGIPGQTVESLLESLEEAVSFAPDEIFLYPLYVKHGARLEREGVVPEPEKAYLQYREGAAYLKSKGFRQDSMRRFVKAQDEGGGKSQGPDRSGREAGGPVGSCGGKGEVRGRNREFSDCGFTTSLALGCGGRSYAGNLHFCTPYAITREDCVAELQGFMECEDYTRITHGIFLSVEEEKRRYAIRHLLIRPGLDRERYRQRFGTEVTEDFPQLSQWIERGFLEERAAAGAQKTGGPEACGQVSGQGAAKRQVPGQEMAECQVSGQTAAGGWLTLTQEGLGLSDCLGPELISPEIRRKMEEWDEVHKKGHDSLQRESEKL